MRFQEQPLSSNAGVGHVEGESCFAGRFRESHPGHSLQDHFTGASGKKRFRSACLHSRESRGKWICVRMRVWRQNIQVSIQQLLKVFCCAKSWCSDAVYHLFWVTTLHVTACTIPWLHHLICSIRRSTNPYFNKKTAESEAAKVALEVNQRRTLTLGVPLAVPLAVKLCDFMSTWYFTIYSSFIFIQGPRNRQSEQGCWASNPESQAPDRHWLQLARRPHEILRGKGEENARDRGWTGENMALCLVLRDHKSAIKLFGSLPMRYSWYRAGGNVKSF